MSNDTKSSDSLDQSIDGGIDKAMVAHGAYQSAQNIGAAAAEAASAAAGSAAAAGAGAGAAAGTGAAVGTAAGPPGTVMGAVAGLAVGMFAKPLVKGIIVIVLFLVMIFSSLPSMLFEFSEDIADNSGPIEVYMKFKEYAMEAYQSEIEKRKEEIEEEFQRRIDSGEFDDYDHIEFSYSFIPPLDLFLQELNDACVLIIAMFEIHTDDWRKATFSDFKRAVNNVNFWSNTVVVELEDETQEVEHDGDEKTIHVHTTYNIFDKGVEQFRNKFGLHDEKDFVKSIEMAYNIKIFFGEVDDLPMGGVTGGSWGGTYPGGGSAGSYPGGGSAGSYPGGGTHNSIRSALAALEDKPEFFGGNTIIPLESYSSITSEFGPRNYAPDPIHTGIDFSSSTGTPIYSAMNGTVLLKLTNSNTFGHHIVIYHGGEITTMYAHMSSFGSFDVGDSVRAGDVIGYVGSTGMSTGSHLHFEYQQNGTAYNPRLILPL